MNIAGAAHKASTNMSLKPGIKLNNYNCIKETFYIHKTETNYITTSIARCQGIRSNS